MAQHLEKHLATCPCVDEMKKEVDYLCKIKPGDPEKPLGRPVSATAEIDEKMNNCITFHHWAAAVFTSSSAFFSRENVALPGVALYFKILAQCEINDAWMVIDFLSKRGAVVKFGPVAAPPSDWVKNQDFSEVLIAFIKSLAIFKAAAKKAAEGIGLACKMNDVQAIPFLNKCACQLDEKIRCTSHYVSHLKQVETDMHAVKNFDRHLPFDIEELAFAAGTEAAIQTRLMIGSKLRAECRETKKFDELMKDGYENLLARRTLNRVI
ncbi:hypothetical protein CY35_09G005400 [Sphagnum magellanicum]|nr:hypothetical protein CY35_09G005400 [Sphagnum magellanicum]